ncbi:MAG: hypothetical protein HC860_01265 [Alkalinema sp. RU_4_3]|nr:hypothetical protein [Alkalinema sp. RU_4_3]
MSKKSYDTKVTNSLVARLICEIFDETKTWVTGREIGTRILADAEGKKCIEYTHLKNPKPKLSSIPPEYIRHFSRMFEETEWPTYIERDKPKASYIYRPISNEHNKFIDELKIKALPLSKMGRKLQEAAKTPTASDIEEIDGNGHKYGEVYRILRDTDIAREVKQLHDYKCQICGETIDLGSGKFYAEAHHIRPIGRPHFGPDVKGNLICVCPYHHVLLDYGVISIDINQLRINRYHRIEGTYVDYHNTDILKS